MATVSKTGICNLALTLIGANTVSNIETDTSKEAVRCNIIYDLTRRSLIRSHPWNFSIKRQVLASSVTTPGFEYGYQYQLPSDCLRVIEMYNSNYEFKIEGNKLLTDANSVKLIYIADIEDPAFFDTSFTEVFSYMLALQLAYSIAGSSNLTQQLEQQVRMMKAQAKQWDGQEGSMDQFDDGPWLNAFGLRDL